MDDSIHMVQKQLSDRKVDLNVASRVESIELVDQLQHGPLHLVITTHSVIEPCTTNRVDLIEEY